MYDFIIIPQELNMTSVANSISIKKVRLDGVFFIWFGIEFFKRCKGLIIALELCIHFNNDAHTQNRNVEINDE